MLEFIWDPEGEKVEIYADKKGLLYLSQTLADISNEKGNEHYHLMTKAWGGDELSSGEINLPDNAVSINHVKLFKWEEDKSA